MKTRLLNLLMKFIVEVIKRYETDMKMIELHNGYVEVRNYNGRYKIFLKTRTDTENTDDIIMSIWFGGTHNGSMIVIDKGFKIAEVSLTDEIVEKVVIEKVFDILEFYLNIIYEKVHMNCVLSNDITKDNTVSMTSGYDELYKKLLNMHQYSYSYNVYDEYPELITKSSYEEILDVLKKNFIIPEEDGLYGTPFNPNEDVIANELESMGVIQPKMDYADIGGVLSNTDATTVIIDELSYEYTAFGEKVLLIPNDVTELTFTNCIFSDCVFSVTTNVKFKFEKCAFFGNSAVKQLYDKTTVPLNKYMV